MNVRGDDEKYRFGSLGTATEGRVRMERKKRGDGDVCQPSAVHRLPRSEIRTSSTAFPISSVPNAFSQSSFFATRPFGTFVKTCSICRTSERSVSLEMETSICR